jgi:hypothetical protein
VAGDWNICRVWNPVAGGLASPAHCRAMRPLLQVQVSRVWIIWCLFSGSHTLFDNSHAVRSLLQVQVSRVWNIWCLFLLAIFFLLIAASCVPLLQVQVSIVCNI